jgi:VanZ family protein
VTALRAYAPAIVLAVVILWIGSRSSMPSVIPSIAAIDKLGHFLMYGALGAVAARGWSRSRRRHAAVWPLLAALLMGLADELNQSRLPQRSAEFGDWIADAAGILAGFALAARLAGGTSREHA